MCVLGVEVGLCLCLVLVPGRGSPSASGCPVALSERA